VNKPTSAVKVLVVDDQPLIVEELCEFLERSGYRCVPCKSGSQAIARFNEDLGIGLVLCDLHMPGMDGIELIKELQRLSGKHRAFEAIMLTGRADKQDVIKALRAGFADYYQKPVDLNELLNGMQRQEVALQEQQKSLQLGHLDQKLQYLSESLDDLYQDLDKVRRGPQWSDAADGEVSDLDRMKIPAMFTQLSPRQLGVAQLVGKGQTNYQIACELGITENTVKLYVSQVLRLTHMHNRTQLALALASSPGNSGGRQSATAH
jgi:DNA-binding NarL/FixJ family response regulator